MNRQIVLTGTHVALAAMTEADQPKFHEWLQNPTLRALIGDARIPTMEDQKKWFQRIRKPDRKFFSLVTVPEKILIGNCGFAVIDAKKREATLRVTIGDVRFLGKGLGSEAVALLVHYGFESMGLARIVLTVLASNARAIRSYQKAGFTAVKDLQDARGMLTMSITASAHS